MASGCFRFAGFTLDPGDRRLKRGEDTLDLGTRYLDALALLLAERGKLVSKDRFMDEVWQGVPVTDEALTQCIRTLRRQLGDDAARPQFIETVPKHGYRFIAEVEWVGPDEIEIAVPADEYDWPGFFRFGAAGALGGGLAGIGGGLLYGLTATPPAPGAGMGTASVLLVLLAVSTALGLAGGAGVGFGIAAAKFVPSPKWQWSVAGGMFGGLAVGALAKLVGLDAFELLFGRAPTEMTGPAEGAMLGAAAGLAVWLGREFGLPPARSAAVGGVVVGASGLLVPLLDGHLLGGSLNFLARQFPESRFRLDAIGTLLGETGFGRASELATATIEGALFGLCLAGGLAIARERQGGG